MAIAVVCPSCRAGFKVRDELAGRKVKCPDCGAVVGVPAGDVEVPRPRKSGGNKMLWIGLGIGCSVLFLAVLGCGGVALLLWYVGKSELNANVTKENFDNKLQVGMTLAQVEAVLGTGKQAAADDFPDLPEHGPPAPGVNVQTLRQQAGQGRVYRWRNAQTNSVLFAAFSGPPSQGGRAEVFLFAVIKNNGFEAHMKGKNFGRNWSETHG